MKFLVLVVAINIAGQHAKAQFQFQLPSFQLPSNQIPSLPKLVSTTAPPAVLNFNPSTIQSTVTPSIPSSITSIGEQLARVIPSQGQPTSQKTFEQIIGSSLNVFPTNPIIALIQDFANFLNGSSLQSLFSPPGVRQLSSNINYGSIPQSLQSSFQNAVEQFNRTVNATFAQGLERVDVALERLNETALSIIALAENVSTTAVEEFEKEIRQYNETVQSCIRDNVPQYQQIISTASDTVVDCVYRKRDEAVAIINSTRTDIVNAVEGAQNLSSAIQQCSSQDQQKTFNFGIVGCYTAAIFNIRSETILLPIQLTRRFSMIDNTVSSTRADIIKCASSVTEAVAVQSLNVTRTIAKCLIEK